MVRTLAVSLLYVAACSMPASAVSFDWATVGNPGNAPDNHGSGYGSVGYSYRISKHEVTNAQYVEFLNAVASTDSFGGADPSLYSPSMESESYGGITRAGSPGNYSYAVKARATGQGSGGLDYEYGNKPVNYVSFFDAMRFANWLHNGRRAGGTETGVYSIADGVSEVRSPEARFWIPSEDEWYKAAYYDPAIEDGVYYDYATSSKLVPDNKSPMNDTGNSANYLDGSYAAGSRGYRLTAVGGYSSSVSPYGTFDQNGNVAEWNESVSTFIFWTQRGTRGGDWSNDSTMLSANWRLGSVPTTESAAVGFRVAAPIPTPTAASLAALACVGALSRRRR